MGEAAREHGWRTGPLPLWDEEDDPQPQGWGRRLVTRFFILRFVFRGLVCSCFCFVFFGSRVFWLPDHVACGSC